MTEFRWLIEAPGPKYLFAREVGGWEFSWTGDHNQALAFRDEKQADDLLMVARALQPTAFEFEKNLSGARAVEHGWG